MKLYDNKSIINTIFSAFLKAMPQNALQNFFFYHIDSITLFMFCQEDFNHCKMGFRSIQLLLEG